MLVVGAEALAAGGSPGELGCWEVLAAGEVEGGVAVALAAGVAAGVLVALAARDAAKALAP